MSATVVLAGISTVASVLSLSIGIIAIGLWWRRGLGSRAWEVVEGEIPFGGGKLKIRPNNEDVQIAHKVWVELATRKAGLPFDPENDVIADIYGSWYELFREIRSLTKLIPAEKIRLSRDTKEIVQLLLTSLNTGLRPHLTAWHARFRTWYEHARVQDPMSSPQELQKGFPKYAELVADLQRVNAKLIQYRDLLQKIAHGASAP